MKKYFIKYQKHSIEPEEIFLDQGVAASKEPLERLEFSVPPLYTRLAFAISILVLASAFGFSFYYQVIQGQVLAQKAEDNSLRLLFKEAPRGLIFDRYGKPLVENRMIFDLTALPLNLPKDDLLLEKEAKILSHALRLEDKPIFAKLKEIRKANRAEAEIIIPDISSQAALFFKSRENELPGIEVDARFQRVYLGGPAFSHILGYTGRVSSEELKKDPELAIRDVVGREGLELFYDKILRGKKGKVIYEVNSRLQITEKKSEFGYEPGKNLTLTIDSELQEYIYDVMRVFVGDRPGGGASVALDPSTGEVLALVSLPSFDNNLFAKGITKKDFDSLINSPKKPLFNRAVAGGYSPGSTIKPFIAAASLKEKIIDPATKIPDIEGRLIVPNPYDPTKPSIFRDWKTHGFVDMSQAIAESCNVYFYIVGGGFQGDVAGVLVNQKGLGVERIKRYLSDFGWGKVLGIDIPSEESGFLPDPEWKAKYRKSDPIWRVGDTYLISIGQGDILVTPLQLTASTAVFANGGKLFKPYILKEIMDADGNEGIEKRMPEVLQSFDFSPEELRVVREGLRLTVAAGSARRLSDLPFEVAGKTGTVQVTSSLEKTNAIFVSFTPYKDPKLILTILIEGGGEGGATAVPIAREVLTWYWQNRIISSPQP